MREQIVSHFLQLPPDSIHKYNWGLVGCENIDLWHIDNNTYINGVPLIVDLDLDMGYLIEVVEKDTSSVSYLVVITTPYGHHSQWWEGDAGTFFYRNVTQAEIATWAAATIHNLIHSNNQSPKKK
jgi:hypothetical protein